MKIDNLPNLKELGYLRVAGATPEIKVAAVDFNLKQHLQLIRLAEQEQIELLVFPDFSLTGASCQDLFKQDILIEKTKAALDQIKSLLKKTNLNLILTIPEKINGRLVKVLYFLSRYQHAKYLLPAEPSSALSKYFATGTELSGINLNNLPILNPDSILLIDDTHTKTKFSLAVYQGLTDLYKNHSYKSFSPNINVVLTSSPELIENQAETEKNLSSFTQLWQTGVIYLSPVYGESTTDYVYSGRSYIFEQGARLAATTLYEPDLMIADLDLQIIKNTDQSNYIRSRSNNDSFEKAKSNSVIEIKLRSPHNPAENSLRYGSTADPQKDQELYRQFPENPFLPLDVTQHQAYFDAVLDMAAQGLRKRLEHINNPQVILGLSGGLDSTLALLIAVRTQKFLNKNNKNILCVSMPGFGTTKRTYNNTRDLAEACATNYLEISISDAVLQHFKDINHDPDLHDVTYENAQARERTQILMDLANQRGGIVLGTGDLSESALGFVTYGGDHLSMYHLNAGIPKTLIRHLIEFEAKNYMANNLRTESQKDLAKILFDILATPVSPELLPPDQGKIAQQTEHIIGPYELHDLFLYYFVRYNFAPRKILFIAEQTFGTKYDRITIIKWLKLFYKRFFANQFKRSAAPDGPIISKITLSPRQGFSMPSDAVVRLWIEDLESLEGN
ncbi:MAG: NAD(+) synthase [Clostridiaceae bacterium]|jgi:NAD+ synthase (glutamine-hydrolysing)|nr:NAD(+) synthase [Bacillota bacterium]NLN51495.1 NAD(+) synthase [Clostridiaceae bacterium]